MKYFICGKATKDEIMTEYYRNGYVLFEDTGTEYGSFCRYLVSNTYDKNDFLIQTTRTFYFDDNDILIKIVTK